jgi:hypothetical protein
MAGKPKTPKIGDYEIPFNKETGELLNYPDRYGPKMVWHQNFTFEETLTIEAISRGRSAAHFLFVGEDGKRYVMFMKDVMEMLKGAANITHGAIKATWTFQKRGDNYGVRFLHS